jgi:uncharacterized membrane protein
MLFKAYLVSLVVLGVLDGLWLGVVARSFYFSQLGPLLRQSFALAPAAAFYFLYPVGLVLLAVGPGVEAGGWQRSAMLGGVAGLLAYGTYNLTNWATLKGWPPAVSALDIIWGGVLSAATAGVAAYVVLRWWR